MTPGTILKSKNGSLFEFVSKGCPTNPERCNREHPVGVLALNRRGKRRFGNLTVCWEASELTPAEGWT